MASPIETVSHREEDGQGEVVSGRPREQLTASYLVWRGGPVLVLTLGRSAGLRLDAVR